MGRRALLGLSDGGRAGALRRAFAFEAAARNGDSPVLLHPVENDLGIRPLEVRVLEGMLHEPVEVASVSEPPDEECVVLARDIVDRVRPRVASEAFLHFSQSPLRDPDADGGPELPPQLLVVQQRNVSPDHALALESRHPSAHRRRGDLQTVGDLSMTSPSVDIELLEDGAVELVKNGRSAHGGSTERLEIKLIQWIMDVRPFFTKES